MRGYLLIDGSNMMFAATANKVKLHAGGMETQGVYQFLRKLRPTIKMFSMLKPLVLWDGVSWRSSVFEEYKASREIEEPANKHERMMAEVRASLKQQKKYLVNALRSLQVTQIQAFNYEADDLAGLLAKRYADKTKVMISGDRDWIQLVDRKCMWYDPINTRRVTPKTFEEFTGVPTPEAFLEYKALHGDAGDDIPGVGGIGDKGAKYLLQKYGSVAKYCNRYIEGDDEARGEHKKFTALVEDPDKIERFKRNLILMDLNAKEIPAPVNLRIDKGEFDEDGFRQICRELAFQSILKSPDWIEPFRGV